MASWIYVFSKFTPEALLFEALIICLICAGYAAFWILRKRRFGVLGEHTPAFAIKSYLNQLILDAEQMRIQLFGLLAGAGVDPSIIAALRLGTLTAAGTSPSVATALSVPKLSAAALAADPELGSKLAAFESKMAEQARVIETISGEKTRVEKELVELRNGKPAGVPATQSPDDSKLKEKIAQLEARLAEYSVIEDDLANLKRLQQENAQLKAQLGGKPAPAPAKPAQAAESEPAVSGPVAEAPSTETAPVEAAPEAQEAQAAEAAVAATDAAIAEASSAPTEAPPEVQEAPAAAAEPVAAATGDPAFEGLVDQVEQSLVEPAAGATVADVAATPAASGASEVPTSARPAPHAQDKTDADLVAEFEKMLNS